MEYPIIIAGREQGRLSVERQGLFMVFEASCPHQHELLRISVYGGGREGYLGLMQPWSGGLYLKRRLSRSELRSFPEKIEYASEAGMSMHNVIVESSDNTAAAEAENMVEADLTWFRRNDGSLVSHDGKSCIIALPSALREDVPRAVIKYIEGQAYMLFRY